MIEKYVGRGGDLDLVSPFKVAFAVLLLTASRALDRQAEHLLVPRQKSVSQDPMTEFHAEAGALEGALYVDGQFIGCLVGVKRL